MDSLLFHPKVVHIPIALSVLMPLIASGVLVSWWRGWLPARAWLLVVALQTLLLASGIVALQTGEAEEERIERVAPERAIEEHEEAAQVFVGASAGALGLMLLALAVSAGKAGLAAAAAATLGAVVVSGLGYRTGQAGGDLVYRYNAGSAYLGSGTQAVPSEVAPERYGGEEEDEQEEDEQD